MSYAGYVSRIMREGSDELSAALRDDMLVVQRCRGKVARVAVTNRRDWNAPKYLRMAADFLSSKGFRVDYRPLALVVLVSGTAPTEAGVDGYTRRGMLRRFGMK